MTPMNRLLIIFVMVLAMAGCSKKESKQAANNIVNGTRNVVEAASDVLRDVADGVNDAVYGTKK